MNILFLYMNAYENKGIPIGLSYLIAMLKKRNHNISVFDTTFYDFGYSEYNLTKNTSNMGKSLINDFVTFVNNKNPDLICVSSPSLCANFSIEMLKPLEHKYLTIFGSYCATTDYENLIKNKYVDIVCVGCGEDCLLMLVDKLEQNDSDYSSIPNLVYKNKGITTINHLEQFKDVSNLPIPDWSLFDEKHLYKIFKGDLQRWGNFQLTRGCPFNCGYCINAYYHNKLKMKVIYMPVEKIIEEIKFLSKKYKLDIIRIFDESAGYKNYKNYEKFGKLYKPIGLPIIIETRPETITPHFIKILKDINCVSVSLGVEVGNEKYRAEILNRHITNDTIKKAFELLHNAKIRVSSYHMIGLPNETKENINETIALIKEIKPDYISPHIFIPFPKTKLREYCIEHNLLNTTEIVDNSFAGFSILKNDELSCDDLFEIRKRMKGMGYNRN